MKDIAVLDVWEVEVSAYFCTIEGRGNSGKAGNISLPLK